MYTFEIHTYSPEQNRIFYNGKNITKYFNDAILKQLNKDFSHNIRLIRSSLKPFNNLKAYKLVATRSNGTTETRFCVVNSSVEALQQLKKAREYYNIEGTILKFNRLYKY